jgi:hypothetical protein
VLAAAPFSFRGECVAVPGDAYTEDKMTLRLFAESTEPGSIGTGWALRSVGDDRSTSFGPGDPLEMVHGRSGGDGNGELWLADGGVALAAPSGATLTIGAINVGYGLFGEGCSVAMFGTT